MPQLAAYSFDAAHGTASTVADLSGNGRDFSIAGLPVARVAGRTAEGVPSIGAGAWGILFLPPNIHIQARSTTTLARASASWSTGVARHVVGTFDGSAERLFLDGTLAGGGPPAGALSNHTG